MEQFVDPARQAGGGPSSPDDVVELIRCSADAAAVGAALELGLFWLLEAGAASSS